MASARQEIDLRPKLERPRPADRPLPGDRPRGVDLRVPSALADGRHEPGRCGAKAQPTQIYAGLGLWPSETTARLVEAQLIEDGTYPGAEGIFAGAGAEGAQRINFAGPPEMVRTVPQAAAGAADP